jgi:hypothetical protein
MGAYDAAGMLRYDRVNAHAGRVLDGVYCPVGRKHITYL